MKKFCGVFGLLGIVAMSMSTGAMFKVFHETYKAKPNLEAAKCSVCHTTVRGGKLNAYGLDLQTAIKKSGSPKLTAAILAEVGKTKGYGEKIAKDQLPAPAK